MPERSRSCNLFAVIVLCLVITCVAPQRNVPQQQNNPQAFEKQTLDRLVHNNQQYDALVRPTVKNTSEPLDISVHVSVQSVEFLDMLKNEFKVHMLITEEWEDSRLTYANSPKRVKYLTVLDPSKIWRPDLYLVNEKPVTSLPAQQQQSFARIFPNGKVSLVMRVSATLSCPVNIRLFPFDSQKCPIKVASAAFSKEDIILKWKSPGNPVDVTQDFALMPGVAYHSVTTEVSEVHTETGTSSCLIGGLIFNRLKGYYWKQLYIPCTSLVIVGWFSFLLDATGIPGIVRATIVSITWTLAYLRISEFHHIMPKVAYSTAFDVYTGMCLAFIYISVLVMIFSTYMANHGHTKAIPPERIQALEARKRLGEISAQYAFQHRSKILTCSLVVDRICVFFYPTLFLSFSVAYFFVYLKVSRIGFEELKN